MTYADARPDLAARMRDFERAAAELLAALDALELRLERAAVLAGEARATARP